MRPRHKAAENALEACELRALLDEASMRPRHKAAENLGKSWSINKPRVVLQ